MSGNSYDYSLMLTVLGASGAATLLSLLISQEVSIGADNPDEVIESLLARLQMLAIVALLIERAVETFLRATGIQSQQVHDEAANVVYKLRPVMPIAALAGIAFSFPVAIMGLRILDPLLVEGAAQCIDLDTQNSVKCGSITNLLLWFVDIALTVGLLAGGSELIHQVITIVTATTTRVEGMVSGRGPGPARGQPFEAYVDTPDNLQAHRIRIAAERAASASSAKYQIAVWRTSGSTGTLTFKHGITDLNADCRWDPDNRIKAGTHVRCSKTVMAAKNRPAIYMPGAVLHGAPSSNIFIHKGKNETWSDGCIVMDEADMAVLLGAITESDAKNITVIVEDI